MIQQMANGMIALMFAKFMLNDVPHYLFEEVTMQTLRVKRVKVDDKEATSSQLRYIAVLSQQLHITEPTVKSFGEAGLMIRELEREKEYRKRLGGGNPGNPGVLDREWTVLLEAPVDAWGRIMSRVEPIAKHLGVRPATVAADLRKFEEIPSLELANEIASVASSEGAERVQVSEAMGPKDKENGENGNPGNPGTATGTCYPDAWRYVMHHTEGVLVHGTAISLGRRIGHAWVELPDGTVWEPESHAIFPIEQYYSLVDPIVEDRYTADEAAMMLTVGKHGPWSAEERMEHIGR